MSYTCFWYFIAKHGKITVSLQMFTDTDNNLAHIVRAVTNNEKPPWKWTTKPFKSIKIQTWQRSLYNIFFVLSLVES